LSAHCFYVIRHNQWITAKLRLINEKIIPALSAGKSMTAEDEYLIFKTNNSRKKQGMSKAEFDKMEAWAKVRPLFQYKCFP
jgi:hypothetical protein